MVEFCSRLTELVACAAASESDNPADWLTWSGSGINPLLLYLILMRRTIAVIPIMRKSITETRMTNACRITNAFIFRSLCSLVGKLLVNWGDEEPLCSNFASVGLLWPLLLSLECAFGGMEITLCLTDPWSDSQQRETRN